MATDHHSTSDLDAKLAELLTLPPQDRLYLSERLLDSVPPQFESPEAERAWSDEIARRIEDFESGRVQGIPAEQVHRELRQRLEAMRNTAGDE